MLISIGRVFLVIIFVYSGVSKLVDIPATAGVIEGVLKIPTEIAPYTAQLEQATGMKTPNILAIAGGALEVVGGLMIAFNIGARWFAALLILLTIAATAFGYQFWTKVGPARAEDISHVLKNLAIIGGLLIVMGLGPPERDEREPQFDDH
jgi:uncharacterized membrane protein YphA (DoxX/SURF4 family)